ncbi:cytochrome C oxidase subunit II [Nostoc sp. 'Peltigera membranacea cyanobiont' 210A]|uniref:cytochrome c oxidase subunit II n=1 Tax=Nostoc sp. 'Peltigera membranacea cyanobiont' 210A TaxID=2014529 RepID=UPI000B95BC50|nr:cytochrome c oxidase subunit II [Nostoc sp. 'Peltigera membranacea cyanobiont' 210A]OYD91520.1 cytochrome C oxidase subunit II [Nostoc sp. 'Peltigera membranacea cyanobiont' 210A]
MFSVFEYVLIAVYVAVLLVVSRWIGQQAFFWMPPQATAEAQRVDDLFSFLVSIGAFILLGLVGVMVYAIAFHRAPPEDYSEGHPSRGDARLEILWTATPTLLVVWIAFQSFNIYQQLDILGLNQIVHLHTPIESASAATITDATKPASETIDVFVKQWDWSFRYPNNVTSNQLHLPINQSTRLNLQAQDVIHGFYVPEFRLKQDIIPGRDIDIVLTPIRPGKYRLKDSQFSGTYFALMETDVYVESLDQYNQWLTQTATSEQTPVNQAVAENIQPPKTLFNSGWYTVTPAQPGIANKRKQNNDT